MRVLVCWVFRRWRHRSLVPVLLLSLLLHSRTKLYLFFTKVNHTNFFPSDFERFGSHLPFLCCPRFFLSRFKFNCCIIFIIDFSNEKWANNVLIRNLRGRIPKSSQQYRSVNLKNDLFFAILMRIKLFWYIYSCVDLSRYALEQIHDIYGLNSQTW